MNITIKEIIQKLHTTMDDARGQESHFESWLTQNEGICDAIDMLKELDKQEQGEPVAWIHEDERIGYRALEWKENVLGYRGVWKKIPLYTTPQQRTWVGLTLEDQKLLADSASSNNWNDFQMMDFIEAKLREKNI